MAYQDDDFQGYSIGDNVPFGNWILDPAAFIASIVTGGPSGTTRCLQVFGDVGYVHPSYLKTFTQFTAVRKLVGGKILRFDNGPNGTSHTFTLVQIDVERDSTITVSCPASGEILANSGNAYFKFYSWNFLQVNLTFSDVNVLGVDYVHVDCEIALDGVSIINFSKTTTFPIAQLTNVTSEVNRFDFTTNGAFYDAYTLDTLQPIVTYPHPGSPSGIVHQGVIEIPEEPDSANVWVHQGAVELAEEPDSANVWVYQGVIELLLDNTTRVYISES